MKKLITILLLVPCLFTLAGCETIAGAGKDVATAGKAIEKEAKDTKKKM
ncbi:entericidin A/B family lipoprotein [Thiothrix eikelboomii]|uniref:Predicted small secreted protein n=1 Tax=Thiothrix eikelboomii TaxID=92487 RepID=A0A1T4WQR0_9GAMM|nr:entericidin A/B family lipoprotein [Thiothrix eikelboomii]SKA79195.1 Predicted small secreted protein [Thiothrix eikelboomii]